MKIKNWMTTLAGWLAGGLLAIDPLIKAYAAGAFDGKTGKDLAIAAAVVLLGVWAGDKNKTNVQNIAGENTPPIKDEK